MVNNIYSNYFPIQRLVTVHSIRVENILTGLSEQSKILYSSSSFVILPDMKWDLKTVSSLYLVSIVQDHTIRSMRDLRKCHIGLLKDIRREAAHIVSEKWGLGNGSLRIYVHYQPSYCKRTCSYSCILHRDIHRSLSCSHRQRQLSSWYDGYDRWSSASPRRYYFIGKFCFSTDF